mmetsp:Transcript_48964/g.114957  ORF Transcript_48964/g.114957 Transcript_48964/m.114957 type:complete len:140 (+) Transcript_48964:196-615(+)
MFGTTFLSPSGMAMGDFRQDLGRPGEFPDPTSRSSSGAFPPTSTGSMNGMWPPAGTPTWRWLGGGTPYMPIGAPSPGVNYGNYYSPLPTSTGTGRYALWSGTPHARASDTAGGEGDKHTEQQQPSTADAPQPAPQPTET